MNARLDAFSLICIEVCVPSAMTVCLFCIIFGVATGQSLITRFPALSLADVLSLLCPLTMAPCTIITNGAIFSFTCELQHAIILARYLKWNEKFTVAQVFD